MHTIPEYLSLEGSRAAYRPVGHYTFDETVDMIDGALAYCKKQHIDALLVDIRGVTGFPPPSIAQRLQFASRWAGTAHGRVVLAMVAPPEIIDPHRIGVTMAENRGLRTEVFTDEPDAIDWLDMTLG